MMNKMILRRFTLLVTLAALVVFAGCEIAVDFDRTKIPVDVTDGSTDSGGQVDTGTPDTGNPEVDAGDAGESDAGDAGHDADAH
ncbi:MAG TPA: hypothetical protein VNO21_10195 [Polyangiaceae bacterium]|nr:hypothetical protein [Polyangiaceae bacterium]